jgi:hypothetical protein
MEVAGQRELLGLSGAESRDAGHLQREPEAQRAEVTSKLRRDVRR